MFCQNQYAVNVDFIKNKLQKRQGKIKIKKALKQMLYLLEDVRDHGGIMSNKVEVSL